jgi:hypothetical protein
MLRTSVPRSKEISRRSVVAGLVVVSIPTSIKVLKIKVLWSSSGYTYMVGSLKKAFEAISGAGNMIRCHLL